MADNDSDSSALSEHSEKEIQTLAPIFLKAKKATKLVAPPPVVSPPKPKRPPSPPHEEVLADNADIAFLVMFRSRFNDALPSKLPNLGPQDIERGVSEQVPSQQAEQLLCALLGLVLNRKKPVERGHHGRALEEAVQSNKSQWPHKWNRANPLHGGKSFENMTPTERLDLLRTLTLWSLTTSEAIQGIIKDKYKQQRHSDDENQPLSVQPWGNDGDKRRYFLVQGLDDTGFRVYREGSRYTRNAHWYSVAGSIEEVKELAKKLEEIDGTQAARRLSNRITNAIPTFEATEEKRARREYRQARRAAFTRPEPGFSLYEGRTRGKRMRYTYDDEEAFLSDATSTRRSARQSSRNTPFETGPTVTSSGRQVRQPRTGEYGESLLSGPPLSTDELAPGYSEADRITPAGQSGTEYDSEQPVRSGSRATRSAARPAANGATNQLKRKHIQTWNDIDELSDEEDADPSGEEWDSDKNDDDEDERMADAENDDDQMSEADEESEDEDEEPQSLVVKLRVRASNLTNMSAASALPQNNDGSTKAGALDCEQRNHDSKTKGDSGTILQPAQPDSSPMGPSAYPTPTSTSFLPPDHKSIIAPTSSLPSAAVLLPLPESTTATNLANGIKMESSHLATEAKPSMFVNGTSDGFKPGQGAGSA